MVGAMSLIQGINSSGIAVENTGNGKKKKKKKTNNNNNKSTRCLRRTYRYLTQ